MSRRDTGHAGRLLLAAVACISQRALTLVEAQAPATSSEAAVRFLAAVWAQVVSVDGTNALIGRARHGTLSDYLVKSIESFSGTPVDQFDEMLLLAITWTDPDRQDPGPWEFAFGEVWGALEVAARELHRARPVELSDVTTALQAAERLLEVIASGLDVPEAASLREREAQLRRSVLELLAQQSSRLDIDAWTAIGSKR